MNDSKEEKIIYGRPDINELLEHLQSNCPMLDGTIKGNRQYCKLLIDKMKKNYPEHDPVALITKLIDVAYASKFHSNNATSFKYLYYHTQKIANEYRRQPTTSNQADIIKRRLGTR